MATQKLPGSSLLAALHASMERIKTVARVCRAAAKKPQNRSNLDIAYITAETQHLVCLTQHGPAAHRDLCHVVQLLTLSEMNAIKLPGEYKSGVMMYVLKGCLQVRAKGSNAAFDHIEVADAAVCNPGSTAAPPKAAADASGRLAASEEELQALFDSIDKDSSGAIDVDELQYALSVLGVNKTAAEVQELMESVDKDGSGELDFEEFKVILNGRLGAGNGSSGSGKLVWQHASDGTWSCHVPTGSVVGEGALVQGLQQEGLVVAEEDSQLLLLDAATYSTTLAHGFDGQLNDKLSVLRACPALTACLSAKSDLRGLAYASVWETLPWGSQLYGAATNSVCTGNSIGNAGAGLPDALYIIQHGTCLIAAKTRRCLSPRPAQHAVTATAVSSASKATAPGISVEGCALPVDAAIAAAAELVSNPGHGLHSSRSALVDHNMDLAVLGPGDLAGEGCLLGGKGVCAASSAVVGSAQLVLLKIAKHDLKQLLHSLDLQLLCRHLQQREDERRQRLHHNQLTATAVVQAHHQFKMAVASATADPATATSAGFSTDSTASGATSIGGNGSYNQALPGSSAAGAAAAIASAGGFKHTGLPSQLERDQVSNVAQILGGLISASEGAKAQQADTGQAAVAMMAPQIVAAASTASSLSGSSMHGCYVPLTARLSCRRSQLKTVRPFTADPLGAVCGLAASAATDAHTGPHSQSCPGTVRLNITSRTSRGMASGSSGTCVPGSLEWACGNSGNSSRARQGPVIASAARGASSKPGSRSSRHRSTNTPPTSPFQHRRPKHSTLEHGTSAVKSNLPAVAPDCQGDHQQEQVVECSVASPGADQEPAAGQAAGNFAAGQERCDVCVNAKHPQCDDGSIPEAADAADAKQASPSVQLADYQACYSAACKSAATSCQPGITAWQPVQWSFLETTHAHQVRPLPAAPFPAQLLAAVHRSAALNSIELHISQRNPAGRSPPGGAEVLAGSTSSHNSTHQAIRSCGGLSQRALAGHTTARGTLQLPWDPAPSSSAGVSRPGAFACMQDINVSSAASQAMLAGGSGYGLTAAQQHEPRNPAAGGSHTPRRAAGRCRGDTAAPSCAQPVPGGLFFEVDMAAWHAAESAADTTSWALGVKLSRMNMDQQLQQDCRTAAAQDDFARQYVSQQSTAEAHSMGRDCKHGAVPKDGQAVRGGQPERGCRGQTHSQCATMAQSPVPRLQLNQLEKHHRKH